MKLTINSSYTIDKIVMLIFEKIDNSLFNERFGWLKEKLTPITKSYDCLLLNSLMMELGPYSLLDLFILEQILEIKLNSEKFPVRVSSFLELEYFFLYDGELTLEFSDVTGVILDYMLEVDEISNNVSLILESKVFSRMSYEKFLIPKMPREQGDSVLEEEGADFRLEIEDSSNLKITYDIDGYNVCLYNYIEGDLNVNLNISFDTSNTHHIFSKNIFCRRTCIPIKDLFNVKLGEFTTHFGRTSVFLINYDKINDIQLLRDRIFVCAGKNPCQGNLVKFDVASSDLYSFFHKLKKFYEYSFIFLESYGNKKYYSSSNFASVYRSLRNDFSSTLILDMCIDIGLTLKTYSEKALFFSKKGFFELHCLPNYHLFFCDDMANFNRRFTTKKDGIIVNKFSIFSKINFYSLAEDIFCKIRKQSFIPEMSMSMIRNNFYGYVHKMKNVRNFDKLLEESIANLNSEKRLGYRFELSVLGRDIPVAYNLLSHAITRNNFLSIDYGLFKDVIVHNVVNMQGLIKGNQLTDLCTNIVIETMLKEFYIKGGNNKHFLTDSVFFNIQGYRRRSSIYYIENILYNISLDINDVVQIIERVLNLSEYDILDAKFTEILKSFLKSYSSNNSLYCIRIVVLQYIKDFKNFYGIDTDDLKLNYNVLLDRERYVDIKEGSVSLSTFLSRDFLGDTIRNFNLPYFYLSQFILKKLSLEKNDFFDLLYTVFCYHGLNLTFKITHRKFPGKKLQALNLGNINVCRGNKGKIMEKLDLEVVKFLATKRESYLKKRGVALSDEERVRLVHGLIRYSVSNKRWLLIKTDFIYGFYLSRPAHTSVYDGYKTLLRSKTLYKYVRQALLWCKEDFHLEQHFSFLGLCDQESEPIRRLYTDIFAYDTANFFQITMDNLNYFYYDFLKKKFITESEFESLKGILNGRLQTLHLKNEFLSAEYIEINLEGTFANHLPVIIRPEVNNILLNEHCDELQTHENKDEITLLKERMVFLESKVKRLEKIIHDYINLPVVHTSVPATITEERENSYTFEPEYYAEIQTEDIGCSTDITLDKNNDELQSENLAPDNDNLDLNSTDIVSSTIVNSLSNDFLHEDTLNNIKLKMKKKYKKTFFTASNSRINLFGSTIRPSVTEWEDVLIKLCNDDFIIKRSTPCLTKEKTKFKVI